MPTLTISQPQDDSEVQSHAEAPAQAAAPRAYEPERDRRAPLSDWFARPAPSEEQLAGLQLIHEEAKAVHVDATDKLERLNGEVRRFTEAISAPNEMEPIVASAQAAEVRARVLDGGIAADEALRVLKLAQKRFDAAITAAREAELVLPDIQAMVVEQCRVVEEKKLLLWKAGRELGHHAAAVVLHGGLRSHLQAMLATIGKLRQIEEELDAPRPIDIKLEHPNGGWFKPEEINAEA